MIRKLIKRFLKDDAWEKVNHDGKVCRNFGDCIFVVFLVLFFAGAVILCVYL